MYWIRKNKYGAIKTTINGKKFDSKKEANYYFQLLSLEQENKITDLQCQVSFELLPAYINNKGKKIRPIHYIADFVYKQNNKIIVVDVKGLKLPEYKIKKKLFEYKFPEYDFQEI